MAQQNAIQKVIPPPLLANNSSEITQRRGRSGRGKRIIPQIPRRRGRSRGQVQTDVILEEGFHQPVEPIEQQNSPEIEVIPDMIMAEQARALQDIPLVNGVLSVLMVMTMLVVQTFLSHVDMDGVAIHVDQGSTICKDQFLRIQRIQIMHINYGTHRTW